MATLAAPVIDWSGGTPPQAASTSFTNELNKSYATGYPVITRVQRAGPVLSDWVPATGGTAAYPIG